MHEAALGKEATGHTKKTAERICDGLVVINGNYGMHSILIY